MAITIKPATTEEAIGRRNTLMLAYIDKVFRQMQKVGTEPVNLRAALGQRSEILAGLRKPGESVEQAQDRIIASFVAHYPLLAKSGAVTS